MVAAVALRPQSGLACVGQALRSQRDRSHLENLASVCAASYSRIMNRYLLLASLLIIAPASTFSQDPASHAAALAARQEQAEERRLMMRDIDDLRQSLVQQQRRINELITDNSALQRQITEM